jgi:hypothetical protein
MVINIFEEPPASIFKVDAGSQIYPEDGGS